MLLGPRMGFPDEVKPPHAPWMTMAGACMLWVGWFGFNAGSALKAGGDAGMAMTVPPPRLLLSGSSSKD
jgi:Amt family ammonium transporter